MMMRSVFKTLEMMNDESKFNSSWEFRTTNYFKIITTKSNAINTVIHKCRKFSKQELLFFFVFPFPILSMPHILLGFILIQESSQSIKLCNKLWHCFNNFLWIFRFIVFFFFILHKVMIIFIA